MTLSGRGAGPRMLRSSLADLILCRYFSESANVIPVLSGGRFVAEILKPSAGSFLDGNLIPERGVPPMIYLRQHTGNAVLKRNFRLPAKSFADFSDIRQRAIWLARGARDMDNLATEQPDEAIDGLRVSGADIEPLPH